MGENKYFTVSVVLRYEDGDKVKKVTEKYLVHGASLTDVETKIVQEFDGETMEYEIKSVVDSKILKVI